MTVSKTTLTLALAATLGGAGFAQAADNPFGLQALDSGYLQMAAGDKGVEGKCGEGKCGGASPKAAEAKCGGEKSDKELEGKCGEGKCGGAAKPAKAPEGKCGEGKCGGAK